MFWGFDDHDSPVAVLCGEARCEPVSGGLADRGLCGLPTGFGSAVGEIVGFDGTEASAALVKVGQAGTFIGFIITAFAPNLIVLFVARMIDGATAGNLSLAQAYISDITKPEDRAKSFGVIGIAFGIGFLIGPAVSGILAKSDYRYPVYMAAGLSALSIIATSILLPKAEPAKRDVEAGCR